MCIRDRCRIMGTGDFLGHPNNNNLTIYVTKLYNEAKYLEPQIPFKSFVRHVSKHLPKDVQTTLMTKEIEDMNELERILDILPVSYTHLLSTYRNTALVNMISMLQDYSPLTGRRTRMFIH